NGASSYNTLYLYKDMVLAGEGTFDKGQLYVGTYRYENGYINTPGSLTIAEGGKLTLSGEYSDIYDTTLSYGSG
ncbi:hypothetical protein DMC47_31005, partial [Nostoc sp. 3335mG]